MKKFNFNIGATVHCRNNKCGKLRRLIVDPDNKMITDLVVQRGLLRTDDRVVPVSLVDRATEDYVMLSISEQELENCPEYRSYDYDIVGEKSGERAVSSSSMSTYVSTFGPVMTRGYMPVIYRQRVHKNIEPGQEVITRGTPVHNRRDKIGKIDQMLADAKSGRLTHLVIDPGIFSDSIVLPISAAEQIDREGILMEIETDQLDQFPTYNPRDDDDIS